jgi:PAS domain-containing protein
MNFFDMNSEVGNPRAGKERILASFTTRSIEIAADAGRGSAPSPTAALDSMRLPAIILDQDGFVADANAAAETLFDYDIKIKDRRLFVRDPAARALLKEAIDRLKTSPRLNPLVTGPIIVQRQDKLPIIVRIWRFGGAAHLPAQEASALLTLNAVGPKPGPPAAILARTFCLTPSEAKLACVIARGAPTYIAARELKIS